MEIAIIIIRATRNKINMTVIQYNLVFLSNPKYVGARFVNVLPNHIKSLNNIAKHFNQN